MVEWQQKGYLKKLINKWYIFSEVPLNEFILYRISNCLYHPSYISLESAFSYYNLIPEGVYSFQAVSTIKTITYHTPVGVFYYRNLKPDFYFGYQILHSEELPILMAEIEKALLDYLYLNKQIKTVQDVASLRFNIEELRSKINWEKLFNYAKVFDSDILNKRIKLLKKIV